MYGNIKKIVTSDSDNLAKKGSEIFCKTANETICQRDRFAVAISGGSTPRTMHRLLAQEPYLSDIPWQKTHIFWVDERMVAYDHPDSNFGTAKKDFLAKIPIPSDQVYPMPVTLRLEEGADLYQAQLNTFFQNTASDFPVFDLILLGIGKDGHIASLFPGQSSSQEPNRRVLSVRGGKPDVFRLTLNYNVLNNAKHILFLVSGSGKASIVKTIFEEGQARLPALRIRPLNGEMTWLLDQEAALLLS